MEILKSLYNFLFQLHLTCPLCYALKVLALQEEALLKLQRHDEADSVLNSAPKFDIYASTKFYGATRNAYVLVIRAQVDMALGRLVSEAHHIETKQHSRLQSNGY